MAGQLTPDRDATSCLHASERVAHVTDFIKTSPDLDVLSTDHSCTWTKMSPVIRWAMLIDRMTKETHTTPESLA